MGETSVLTDHSRRLASAAYAKVSVDGDVRAAEDLLGQAGRAAAWPTPESAIAASSVILSADGDIGTAHRLLLTAIDHPAEDGADDETAATTADAALRTLEQICYAGGHAELWATLRGQLGLAQDWPQCRDKAGFPVLAALAASVADPVRTPPAALSLLDAEIAALSYEPDPSRVTRIAMTAVYVDRLPGCRHALRRVSRAERAASHLAEVINAEGLLAIEAYQTGQWAEATRLAEAAAALCEAQGYELYRCICSLVWAFVLADRGHAVVAEELAGQIIRWAAPRRAGRLQAAARYVSVRCALAESDFSAAYDHAVRISPAGTLAAHEAYAPWVMLDLVEAALRTGRVAEATAHVAAMRDAGVAAVSPRLALLATTAEAMVAADADADALFGRALAIEDVDRWPFDLARTRLLYGEWLRRNCGAGRAARQPSSHVITAARAHLAAAYDAFRWLGAGTWADRAAAELRATGLVRQRGLAEELTPQELQIAQLAATGLSNKQIGSHLFLSHRTVGAHLYRIFPKLGITSRAALRDALSRQQAAVAGAAVL